MSFKFNPLTSNLDLVGSSASTSDQNFSFTTVDIAQTLVVPEGQEMVHSLDVMVRGNLMVRGNTFHIPDSQDLGFFWTKIPANTRVKVPENRLMLYVSPLLVLGNLMVDGLLKEVS